MALKLFQDHFIDSDQFEDLSVLYDSSNQALADTVVAYEVYCQTSVVKPARFQFAGNKPVRNFNAACFRKILSFVVSIIY